MKIRLLNFILIFFLFSNNSFVFSQESKKSEDNDELDEESDENKKSAASHDGFDKKEKEIWQKYDSPHLKSEVITSSVKIEDIIESSTEYTYSSFGKSDPFVPPMMNDLVSKIEVPITSSLQKFPISSLTITGIWMTKEGQGKALIVTPEGEGVVSKTGDYIGQKGGEIVSIESAKIKVREFIPTPDGSKQFIDMDIYMGKYEDQQHSLKETESTSNTDGKDKIEPKSIYQEDGYLDQTSVSKQRIKNRDFSSDKADKIKNMPAKADLSQLDEIAKKMGLNEIDPPKPNNGLITLPDKQNKNKNNIIEPVSPASKDAPK